MNSKVLIQFAGFILFFLGIYRYFMWKSKKCGNKECACPIKDNLIQGYLVVGVLAVLALLFFILVELYIN